jgi:hypothetical protein
MVMAGLVKAKASCLAGVAMIAARNAPQHSPRPLRKIFVAIGSDFAHAALKKLFGNPFLSWPPFETAIQDNKFHLFGSCGWMAGSSPATTSVPAHRNAL